MKECKLKIVHLTYPIEDSVTPGPIVLALGFFDGVHLGHQKLIKRAKIVANEKHLPLMVMTFDRHPKEIYAGKTNFRYIDTLTEKADKIAALGVDYLAIAPFTHGFSKLSPQEFVDQVIVALKADTVVAGFDYTFGPKDVANMENLPYFAKNRFEIVILPEQTSGGSKIGSTAIRKAIKEGKIDLATELLGSHYITSGIVGHGKRNGHKLGYPTANLILEDRKVIPKIGVYATRTLVNGKWYESMTSVGYNVTIGNSNQIYIETNIFDFDENIYDEPITIEWYKYTRGEIKFDSLDELKKQLDLDQIEIKNYFRHKKD
ncbi:riboflavin biosynthesis protein RibF [Lactobacillus psittaci]|uniref:riboflavin biosynthesis protein RibF n=1 Tax=Lactobacillus psittaci TaxID=116089 RepID=UPI00191C4F8C|nr:riboflavin biosynthesis protein RibF [Lactobacillus psittaci]